MSMASHACMRMATQRRKCLRRRSLQPPNTVRANRISGRWGAVQIGPFIRIREGINIGSSVSCSGGTEVHAAIKLNGKSRTAAPVWFGSRLELCRSS